MPSEPTSDASQKCAIEQDGSGRIFSVIVLPAFPFNSISMEEVSTLSLEHETKSIDPASQRIIDVGQFVSAATLQQNAVQKALVQNQMEPAESLAGIICAYCSPDFHWATVLLRSLCYLFIVLG